MIEEEKKLLTLFKCLLRASIVSATLTNISFCLRSNPMNTAHFIDAETKHDLSEEDFIFSL